MVKEMAVFISGGEDKGNCRNQEKLRDELLILISINGFAGFWLRFCCLLDILQSNFAADGCSRFQSNLFKYLLLMSFENYFQIIAATRRFRRIGCLHTLARHYMRRVKLGYAVIC